MSYYYQKKIYLIAYTIFFKTLLVQFIYFCMN